MAKIPRVGLIMALLASAPAFANLALVQEKQCLQCHAIDKDMIGPSFKRIAFRWNGNSVAEKMLTTTILYGTQQGGQHWGSTTSMPNGWERPVVSQAEAQKIFVWIMGQ
jgi:cytochrome c